MSIKYESIFLAGFGGQGILFAGKLLASAGMAAGKRVTWLPAYGAEMRGGIANCSVIISDDEIGSPIISRPDILVALNLPSFEKFEPAVVPGGLLLANSSLIGRQSERSDIGAHYIPATSLAIENGLEGFANVIMIGKLLRLTGIFTLEQLTAQFPAAKAHLLEFNKKALALGYGYN